MQDDWNSLKNEVWTDIDLLLPFTIDKVFDNLKAMTLLQKKRSGKKKTSEKEQVTKKTNGQKQAGKKASGQTTGELNTSG